VIFFRFDPDHSINYLSLLLIFALFIVFSVEINADTIAPVDISINQFNDSTNIEELKNFRRNVKN